MLSSICQTIPEWKSASSDVAEIRSSVVCMFENIESVFNALLARVFPSASNASISSNPPLNSPVSTPSTASLAAIGRSPRHLPTLRVGLRTLLFRISRRSAAPNPHPNRHHHQTIQRLLPPRRPRFPISPFPLSREAVRQQNARPFDSWKKYFLSLFAGSSLVDRRRRPRSTAWPPSTSSRCATSSASSCRTAWRGSIS